MPELKIELSGSDINAAVADAVVKSVLGDKIVKAVDDCIQNILRGGYDNPLKKVVDTVAMEKIRELIATHEPTMVAEVHKQLSEEAVKTIVSKAIDKLTRNL